VPEGNAEGFEGKRGPSGGTSGVVGRGFNAEKPVRRLDVVSGKSGVRGRTLGGKRTVT